VLQYQRCWEFYI